MTIRAFNGKITKSASLSASLRVKDYKLLDLTKTAATISLWISQTINGKESGDYVEDVDVPVGTAVTEWYEKGEEAVKLYNAAAKDSNNYALRYSILLIHFIKNNLCKQYKKYFNIFINLL